MPDLFPQIQWDDTLQRDCRALIRLALEEDLGATGDLTTRAVVPASTRGAAAVVARAPGVVAGLGAVGVLIDEASADLDWTASSTDATHFEPGATLGVLRGSAHDLLACERVMLNLLGRLCGVATLTHQYVEAVRDTGALVLDTRKTTPGWRRLEKYAVACGGGHNHRLGLEDAVLIKDNHLALAGDALGSIADAVTAARKAEPELVIEIEVDTLDQLRAVLPTKPDVVLLDNMTLQQLREAVELRDMGAPSVVLEASGGVSLETIASIAQTGVEHISVGALTHQAVWLDLGLDWIDESGD